MGKIQVNNIKLYANHGCLDEEAKIQWLSTMDASGTNFEQLSPIAKDTLATVRAIKEIQEKNGRSGCNRYIISQCKTAVHLLEVFSLFVCSGWKRDAITVDIIPLFESMEGMANSELIMKELFDIPQSVLPTVVSSSGVIGNCEVIPGYNIPIGGIAGDQQAALFGQLCIDQGMVKNTYGTGCFMLMNTGEQAIRSTNNLLTTIAWQLDGKTEYALEGSVFIGGAVVQWLRDQLKVIHSAPDIEKLASSVPDSQGVYVVPAFAGLGAPYWNAYARGSIFGLTRGSNQAHIARAALDSIAYQSADLLHAMQADAKIPIQELRVDGGATVNDLLMQFQSDLLDCKVVRPVITETTALGAAYLAGLAVGYWTSKEQLRSLWKSNHSFTPQIDASTRQQLLKGWQRAVNASIAWATNQ